MSAQPLPSGMPAVPAASTAQPQISKEAAAIENMAHQAVLFKGIEGFTPRVLTAKEVTRIKTALADEKTDSLEKIRSFTDLYEEYGSFGDTMLEELELAPPVNSTLKLALMNPRQEPFAAETISMLFSRDGNREKSMQRLRTIAGSNEDAQKILASLKAENNGVAGVDAMQDTRPAWSSSESSIDMLPSQLPSWANATNPGVAATEGSTAMQEANVLGAVQTHTFVTPKKIHGRVVAKKNDKERALLRDLASGKVLPIPNPKNKKAVQQYEKTNRFFEQYIAFYHAEKPEQITGGSVWEAGQNKWQGNNSETRRYYIIGKRPLEGFGGATGYKYGPNIVEHRHFIASDGKKNRGLMEDGFRAESPDLILQYEYYNEKKYDAELIEQAMVLVEKRMEDVARGPTPGTEYGDSLAQMIEEEQLETLRNKKLYNINYRNCQDYINEVLKEAEQLAKQNKTTLILQ